MKLQQLQAQALSSNAKIRSLEEENQRLRHELADARRRADDARTSVAARDSAEAYAAAIKPLYDAVLRLRADLSATSDTKVFSEHLSAAEFAREQWMDTEWSKSGKKSAEQLLVALDNFKKVLSSTERHAEYLHKAKFGEPLSVEVVESRWNLVKVVEESRQKETKQALEALDNARALLKRGE